MEQYQKNGTDKKRNGINDYRYRIGQSILCSVFIVIAFLSFLTGKEIDYGVRAILLAYVAGETYITWKFEKSKIFLFFSIAAGFNAILALIEVACRMFEITL